MDFFRDDMASLGQNVGTSAVHLFADMTDILEDSLAENGVDFDALTGDPDTNTGNTSNVDAGLVTCSAQGLPVRPGDGRRAVVPFLRRRL